MSKLVTCQNCHRLISTGFWKLHGAHIIENHKDPLTSLVEELEKMRVDHGDCCVSFRGKDGWCDCGTVYINSTIDDVLSLISKLQEEEK